MISRGGQGKGGRRQGGQTPKLEPKKFTGDTEGLEGHIFDVDVRNRAGIFAMTQKKLVAYAGRPCREPHDIRIAIEELTDPVFTPPVLDATSPNPRITNHILDRKIEIFIKRKN